MAEILASPSSSSVASWSQSLSPSNYEMGRVDYQETGIKAALKDLLKLTIPITLTSLFVSFLLFANLVWIGHHSDSSHLAGAALGNMIVNVMGNSIIIGMTSGLDTQCGQAFGARLFLYMGVLTQRSILVSHVVVVIIGIVFWWADDILVLLGQQQDNADNAGTFIRIFILCLWPIAMFSNLRRYLQAQRQVVFIPVAVIIGLLVQIIALLVLVNALGYGFKGACYALPCTYWSMAGSLFFFTRCNKKLKKAVASTWPGWGSWALQDWSIFVKLSVAGTFQLCAEWWALEVGAIFAGYMGATDDDKTNNVSGFTVCINCLGLFARVPLGVSFAAAVLVGNKLGAKRPQSAKIIYDLAIALSLVFGVLFAAWMIIFPSSLANFYTKDAEVRTKVKGALPFVGVYFIFYAYQRAAAGGVRGMGRQKWGATFYIIAYYCLGMPFGIYCSFKGLFGNGKPMDLQGLWMGAAVSSAIGSMLFFLFRLFINWDTEVERAQARIQLEQIKMKAFKERVTEKYGDKFLDDGPLLENNHENEDGLNIDTNNNHDRENLAQIQFKDEYTNNNGNNIVDEMEPEFDDRHQIKNINTPQSQSKSIYNKGGIKTLNDNHKYINGEHSINSTDRRGVNEPPIPDIMSRSLQSEIHSKNRNDSLMNPNNMNVNNPNDNNNGTNSK